MSARASIANPSLVLITDNARLRWRHPRMELDDVARDAVFGGVNIVQLREKTLPREDLLTLGLRIRDAIEDRALLFVNGDVEAARALRADGLHLPSYGPTVRDVKREVGDRFLISLAVHSKEKAISAQNEGVDLVQLGSIFATSTHPDVEPLGLDALREVCAAVTIPVIAIGGITAGNAPDVMAVGAAGVAVISAIHDAPNPRQAAATLRAAINP